MTRFQFYILGLILTFLCVHSSLSVNVAAQPKIDEQTAFDSANQDPNPFERITALGDFIKKFPRSQLKIKAGETIVEIHAQLGEVSLRNNDLTGGLEQFRLAIARFAAPMSDETFSNVVVKIPFNLYFRNQPQAAADRAREIEAKITDNAPRLLKLSEFYLSTENALEAKRVAERALTVAPKDANVYQTLGLANRMNFRLESASQAYSRALALDAGSVTAKRNLADTLRGLGQTEDALKLYRELLQTDANDEAAHNGFTLALFDANRKTEAEQELTTALERNPRNLSLLSGAAYWYAANGNGARAVDLANRAIAIEPRYVWASIALARGLLLEKKPLEAERALLIIQQYANFPTLNYELASVHAAAGFYAEASDDLKRSFTLKNGTLTTNLANRTKAEAANFEELLARERRASIFQPVSASDKAENRKLKELLTLSEAVNDKTVNEKVITKAALNFAGDANDVNGTSDTSDKDEMRVHRQLFAANRLLEKRIALPQILELTTSATENLEVSLDVPAASAAVLAEELYEPRRLARTNNKVVSVPIIPRSTLSKVMRGRVEEIIGWTFYQQNDLKEAAIHLKLAIEILPANSAWWRSSNWKLGSVLEASGNSNEALNAYIKSYKSDVPNEINFAVIKNIYQKLNNGSLEGLEAKMEIIAPDATSQASLLGKADRQTGANATTRNPLPQIIGKIIPKTEPAKPLSTPRPTPEINPETVAVVIKPTPQPTPKPTPQPTPEQVPEPTPEPTPQPVIEPTPQPTPEATPEAIAAPTPEIVVEATQKPTPQPTPEIIVTPTPELKVEEKPIPAISKSEGEINQNAVAVAETASQTTTNTVNTTNTPNEQTSRPRVVVVDISKQVEPVNLSVESVQNGKVALTQTIKANAPANVPCSMWFSQSPLSILRNGGRTSLLVVLENASNTDDLTMNVNAPDDVIIAPVEDVIQDKNRRLYEVRSTTERTGEFTISFNSQCGKQDVKVRVR